MCVWRWREGSDTNIRVQKKEGQNGLIIQVQQKVSAVTSVFAHMCTCANVLVRIIAFR